MVSSLPAPWVLAALSALAAALLVVAAATIWESAEKHRRQRGMREQLEKLKKELSPASATGLIRDAGLDDRSFLEVMARRLLRERQIQTRLDQAGMTWSVPKYYALIAGGAVLLAALVYVSAGGWVFTTGGFVLGALLPKLYVGRRRTKRLAKLEEQLPEAIDLLGRSIRAGHAVSAALTMLVEESPEPIAGEFRRLVEEQKFGLPFEESLLSLTERIPLVDIRIFATAVLIQREVGGNLTEILDKLSYIIRQRFTLQRQVMVFTAEGRLSAIILAVLPLGVGGILFLLNPTYVLGMFEHEAGRMMAGGAVGMQILGYLWARSMVKIDY